MGISLTVWMEWLAAALVLVASVFLLVGAIGLVRLPDFYMRLHAPTKASTLGVGGVLLASMLVGLAQGQPGDHAVCVCHRTRVGQCAGPGRLAPAFAVKGQSAA